MCEIDFVCGDCLQMMKEMPDNFIDLCYADPPFFTQSERSSVQTIGKGEYDWGDKWRSLKDYISWMKIRIEEIHRLLKNIGSFYLHCDWHAGHYLKVMLDEVFGYNNFVNEIIWFYKTGGASKDRFARKHDTIFLYQKSDKRIFNLQQEKSFMMHKYGFKKSDFKIDKETGLQYSMVYMKDVWELPAVGSATKERLGYPTQKPIKLLERIIGASSSENDLILDPFIGSGTTAVACLKLNRHCIGIDNNPDAIKLAEERIKKEELNA